MFLLMPLQKSDIKIPSTLETVFGEQLVAKFNNANPLEYDRHITPDHVMYFTAYFTKEHEAEFVGIDNHDTFFTPTDRVRMVERIMGQTPFEASEDLHKAVGIANLKFTNAFKGIYPLHDGPCEVSVVFIVYSLYCFNFFKCLNEVQGNNFFK